MIGISPFVDDEYVTCCLVHFQNVLSGQAFKTVHKVLELSAYNMLYIFMLHIFLTELGNNV